MNGIGLFVWTLNDAIAVGWIALLVVVCIGIGIIEIGNAIARKRKNKTKE